MSDFEFEYHVGRKPTHRLSGSLDVVCTQGLCCKSLDIEDVQLSDHFLLYFSIGIMSKRDLQQSALSSCREKPRYYDFRDYKVLNCEKFVDFVSSKCGQLSNGGDNPDDLSESIVRIVSDSVDEFAPVSQRKTKKKRRSNYVFDQEISEAKQVRRQLERQYRKNKLEVYRQMLKSQVFKVRDLVLKHKARVVRNKLSTGSPKELFAQVRSLISPDVKMLPSGYDDDVKLAEDFATFFQSKVDSIVSEFNQSLPMPIYTENPSIVRFAEFSPLSVDQVHELRRIKCSQLDPIPTQQFSLIWPVLLPYVCKLVNMSLKSGVFPTSYKESHITPLIKSPSLDSDLLQSYRPVSNLSFLSKVIETAVGNQLMKHFDHHKLLDQNQSAYRPHHSVETAVQHVYSSILHQLDRGRSVFLVLVDLSAAFDTISHEHLLSLLSSRFGVSGTVLSWLQSYLSGRSYRVKINNELSAPVASTVGVPQGSVLGPILFNCVMSVLPKLLRDFGVGCHTYADDTQFWVSFDEAGDFNNEATARWRISQAFGIISKFMLENHLKLNPKKTQFIPFSRKTDAIDFAPLALSSDVSISPSSEVRNLGLIMDSKLNFHAYVSDLRRNCFFHLKRLKAIRCFIPQGQLATLVHAFITSRLDFCNSVFYRLPDNLISRIQTVQNSCAKCLTGKKKYDSATQARIELHWLPIRARASFKILVFAHKVVHQSVLSIFSFLDH